MNIQHPRRQFLASATLCIPAVHSFAQERASELRIGLAADAQFADAEPKGKRHYREGDNRLADAVVEFNRQNVDCCFHLGDLIDRDFASFDVCLNELKRLTSPCYQVLGNHDFDVAMEEKPKVPKHIGLPSRYYSQQMDKFRFIMLDGTDVSTYTYTQEDPRHQAAESQLAKLKADGAKNAKPWNGGIGPKQLRWLESQLTAAENADERVFLMCHYPVFPVNPHNLWNDREVLNIIDRHPCVLAWLNGHNHAGNYGERNGVHYVTLSGMVEHEELNAFGVATISHDSMRWRGFGRQPSRDLKLAVS